MKRMHPIVAIFILVILGACWQIISLLIDHRPITNYPPKGTRIVALGDSLTIGVGASSPDAGFIAVLQKRLDTTIVNKGLSGDTTRDALLRLEKDVLDLDPDIVIVLLGGNDYLKQLPEAETFSNLRSIISRSQAEGAIVLLLGVRGGILADHFSENFETLADETGVVYVPDVLDGIIGDKALMTDEIHPNDKGYEKMADKVAPDLLGLISVAPSMRAE